MAFSGIELGSISIGWARNAPTTKKEAEAASPFSLYPSEVKGQLTWRAAEVIGYVFPAAETEARIATDVDRFDAICRRAAVLSGCHSGRSPVAVWWLENCSGLAGSDKLPCHRPAQLIDFER